ncbi:VOC family protein [Acinetobacter dispersus]|uniref:VOC family protein n=1 Tax=Acinetobacter dispersus TaxID=70348 RepID=UPI00132ECCDF|nr:VOC family protein [Acinetobacter dispersus]MCH7385071.1 VOC family protein [Acinetobacter dispersus]QHH99328.1 VOC family protein [Acinetobacter dispersus]
MQLNHYLNFKGQTEQAFNFYKSVFGGEFAMLSRYGDMPPTEGVSLSEADKNLVLHVSLPINEFTVLMASDVNDQFCTQNSVFAQGNNHYISINLDPDEQDEAQRLFNALSANGQIEMPLEKTFWGALYGAFTDQFGIKWMINCQLDE